MEAITAERRRVEELGVITMRSTVNNETSLTIPNAIANLASSPGEHTSRAARALNKPTRAQKTMARKRAKRGRRDPNEVGPDLSTIRSK